MIKQCDQFPLHTVLEPLFCEALESPLMSLVPVDVCFTVTSEFGLLSECDLSL